MLNPKQPLSATTSTTEELNSLSLPQAATRSTSNPILPASSDACQRTEARGPASQLSRSENTNISIDGESTAATGYPPSTEHNSFFSRNYNESLIRLLGSNGSNRPATELPNRASAQSMLNNLFNFKSLSGSILSSIQRPFQNTPTTANPSSQYDAASHTCNLGYRLADNLSDLNRTSTEPLIDPQTTNDAPHYFASSSRYQAFTNDSPSFSASSSNNFSFATVNTTSTGLTNSKLPPSNEFTPPVAVSEEQLADERLANGHAGLAKSSSAPGANLLNNNIFKLNLDNLADEQNAFNMCGNASLSSKQLTIYEKRYLLAVERGDLAGVRRMIEMAPQIEQQEKEKGDYSAPVFNINCTDPIGRSALLMAIDNENLDMIELLVECGVQMKDSLLHAINEEFVEAVELLLDYEEALQRNKRAALESGKSDTDPAKDLDKPISFNFDFRPTLLQTTAAAAKEDNEKADAHSLGSFSQKGNASKANPFNQVQNAICNKLSLNSNSSAGQKQAAASNPPIVYSWEGLIEDRTFTNDVTPLILAAHKNNYEIIKLLLDRGIS